MRKTLIAAALGLLLAPAVAMLGGARRVVSLTNEEFQLAAPGAIPDPA